MNEERFRHYTLGHPVLDKAHWEMAQVLSQLTKELKAGNFDKARPLLEDIVRHTVEHDLVEQALMVESKYPYAAWHILQNERIIKESNALLENIDKRNVDPFEIHAFEDKLLGHIDWDDRQLADWLNK